MRRPRDATRIRSVDEDPDSAIEIRLVVESATDPLRGRALVGTEFEREFIGWTALAAALASALEHAGEPSRGPHS